MKFRLFSVLVCMMALFCRIAPCSASMTISRTWSNCQGLTPLSCPAQIYGVTGFVQSYCDGSRWFNEKYDCHALNLEVGQKATLKFRLTTRVGGTKLHVGVAPATHSGQLGSESYIIPTGVKANPTTISKVCEGIGAGWWLLASDSFTLSVECTRMQEKQSSLYRGLMDTNYYYTVTTPSGETVACWGCIPEFPSNVRDNPDLRCGVYVYTTSDTGGIVAHNNSVSYAVEGVLEWATTKVVFDADGGMVAESERACRGGEVFGPLPIPVRDGYRHLGWFTAKDGKGVRVQDSDVVSGGERMVTLFAAWEEVIPESMVVVFLKNGGSDGSESVVVRYGEAMPTADPPQRAGYSFVGYFDAVDDGVQYYAADMSSMRTWDKKKDADLFAHWVTTDPDRKFDYRIVPDGIELVCGASTEQALLFPEEIEGLRVVAIGEGAFSNGQSVVEVQIPDSVRRIGARAFYQCRALESIRFGGGVTNVGVGAFYQCTNVVNVDIRDIAAFSSADFEVSGSLLRLNIGSSPFAYAKSKKVVSGGRTIDDLIIPECVSRIGTGAFAEADIQTVTIGDRVVEVSKYAFYGCSELRNVHYGRNLRKVGLNAFGSCARFPRYDFDSMADYAQIDYDGEFNLVCLLLGLFVPRYLSCSGMQVIDAVIPDGVGYVGKQIFSNSLELRSVCLPSSVTNLGAAVFANAVNVSNIVIGADISALPVETFYNCTNLMVLKLGCLQAPEVGTNAFAKVNTNAVVRVPFGSTGWNGVVDSADLPETWFGLHIVNYPPEGCCLFHFDPGGGTGSRISRSFERDEVVSLPSCTAIPPAGKTRFAGWACSNGKRYDDGVLVFNLAEPGETVTMTAIWE